jgi:hypothetical protein
MSGLPTDFATAASVHIQQLAYSTAADVRSRMSYVLALAVANCRRMQFQLHLWVSATVAQSL